MKQELFNTRDLKNEDEIAITDYLKENKQHMLYLGLNSQQGNGNNGVYCAILEPNPRQGSFIYSDSKIVGGRLKVKDGFESVGSVYKEALDELLEKTSKEGKIKNKEQQMPIKTGLDDLIYSGLNLFISAKEQGLALEAKLFFPTYGSTVVFSDSFNDLFEMNQFYTGNQVYKEVVSKIKEGIKLNKCIQESLDIKTNGERLLRPLNSDTLSQEFLDNYCKEIKELEKFGLTLEGVNALLVSELFLRFYK